MGELTKSEPVNETRLLPGSLATVTTPNSQTSYQVSRAS